MPRQTCDPPTRILSAVTLVLPVLTSACGFVLVHAPPAGHEEMDFFQCTESNTGPALDMVAALMYGLAGVAGLAADPSGGSADYVGENVDGSAVFYVALGAAYGVSGVVGFGKTSECRKATADLVRRLQAKPDTTVHTVAFPALVGQSTARVLFSGSRAHRASTPVRSGLVGLDHADDGTPIRHWTSPYRLMRR